MNSSESVLIHDAQHGKEHAFRALYDLNVDVLYRFLRQFSTSNSDWEVEEWIQRAFIKAFQRIHAFRGDSLFRTWLFRIGFNEMLNDKKASPNIVQLESIPDADYEEHYSQEHEQSFECGDSLKRLLDKLPESRKAVFVLYEIEGYSHTEIAEILDISESASRAFLARAKSQLRILWNESMRMQ